MRQAVFATSLAGMMALAIAAIGVLDLFADKAPDTKTDKTPVKNDTPPPKPEKKEEQLVLGSRSQSAALLPVAQVVLFNSGVGYFQREGEIEGTTRIDLSFPVQDINDMLKSLVTQDLNGGQISAISFDSQAPIEKTLRSFAIDLSKNPTFGQILDQARGEKVEVVLQQSNTTQPGTLTGSIIGIEQQKQPVGAAGVVEVEQLNLWCAEGMRSVKLSDLQRVRFLNPVMDSEFKKALEVVTLSHDTQKKAVSLNCVGEGRRTVRVSYVVENPIWKTSYRLVLSKEKKPYLQGWAVVENTTDEDWTNVNMALVSGRPISFQMDLYNPLYVPRPVVEPELFASLRPPTYTGALEHSPVPADAPMANEQQLGLRKRDAAADKGGFGGEGKGNGQGRNRELLRAEKGVQEMDLKQGVANAATAQNLGDYFEYSIDHPITLGRQKSAMLPIVGQPIDAERVSIYNERVHPKFPLLGLKFKNNTDLHLTQGPITVFEGSNYAGDARILDLQPKEERLISYAIDLGTEVQALANSDNGRLTSVKIQKGIIYTSTKVKDSKTYTMKNRSEHDRLVMIEHPFRGDFHLVGGNKPVETASDVYRFQVKVGKGETVKEVISEEKDINQSVTLTNFDDNRMQIVINDTITSPKIKEALKTAQDMKWRLSKTQQDIGNQQREMNTIKLEQPRLRENLAKIPLTDPLAKRILEKLNQQETEIEKYEAEIKRLNALADQQRKDYEGYLASLSIE